MIDEWLIYALIGGLLVYLVARVEFLHGRVDTISEYLRKTLAEVDALKRGRS